MNKKIGRNDPCPCGSGKKYKSCCLAKDESHRGPRKLQAKWLNAPSSPNLIERTFGNIIDTSSKIYVPAEKKTSEEQKET